MKLTTPEFATSCVFCGYKFYFDSEPQYTLIHKVTLTFRNMATLQAYKPVSGNFSIWKCHVKNKIPTATLNTYIYQLVLVQVCMLLIRHGNVSHVSKARHSAIKSFLCRDG